MILIISEKCISKDNSKHIGEHGRIYLPHRFKKYEEWVRLTCRMQYRGKPFSTFVSVYIEFYMKSRVHADISNLPKGLLDALQGIAYINDRQIKKLTVKLKYGAEEKTVVQVQEMELE